MTELEMKPCNDKSIKFEQTTWQHSCNEILSVRHKVFLIEQHFSDNVLCDARDIDSRHLVARNRDGMVVACGRLSSNGRLGRIAVLLPYRGIGIGSKILDKLVQIGRRESFDSLSLNAELDNRHFYDLQKFSAAGPVFMKQGVPHQMLARKLA